LGHHRGTTLRPPDRHADADADADEVTGTISRAGTANYSGCTDGRLHLGGPPRSSVAPVG
jgi:hypothetical protein